MSAAPPSLRTLENPTTYAQPSCGWPSVMKAPGGGVGSLVVSSSPVGGGGQTPEGAASGRAERGAVPPGGVAALPATGTVTSMCRPWDGVQDTAVRPVPGALRPG